MEVIPNSSKIKFLLSKMENLEQKLNSLYRKNKSSLLNIQVENKLRIVHTSYDSLKHNFSTVQRQMAITVKLKNMFLISNIQLSSINENIYSVI